MEDHLYRALVTEFRIRVFEESFQRLRRCLDLLNTGDIWKSPNSEITSIGSTVLHIDGNARQWIGAIAGEEYDRNRDAEFDPQEFANKEDLLTRLDSLQLDLDKMLTAINGEKLEKKYRIQVFDVSGLSAFVHVIEHVSYHTGQVTLLTKLFTGKDTGYYGDHSL